MTDTAVSALIVRGTGDLCREPENVWLVVTLAPGAGAWARLDVGLIAIKQLT